MADAPYMGLIHSTGIRSPDDIKLEHAEGSATRTKRLEVSEHMVTKELRVANGAVIEQHFRYTHAVAERTLGPGENHRQPAGTAEPGDIVQATHDALHAERVQITAHVSAQTGVVYVNIMNVHDASVTIPAGNLIVAVTRYAEE